MGFAGSWRPLQREYTTYQMRRDPHCCRKGGFVSSFYRLASQSRVFEQQKIARGLVATNACYAVVSNIFCNTD